MRYAASLVSPYDLMPYPSAPLPRTHPHYLGGLALLHGLDAPAGARILDIGCGAGRNLAWISATMPDAGAYCVGVDLAGSAIVDARVHAALLGVAAEFRVQDFRDLDFDSPKFDVIIANGLYSWVPASVRGDLLRSIDALLSLDGVAYVSFHEEFRPWRDALMREIADPFERLRAAKQRYPEELEDLDDGLLFHDALAEISDPVSLAGFEAALPAGLQFLCDARQAPEPHFHEAVLIHSGREPVAGVVSKIWWVTEESFPATVRDADPAEAIEALSHPRPLVCRAGANPIAWAPARRLAAAGQTEVLNYFGALVELDSDDRKLLSTLDGSRPASGETIDFFARAGLLVA